jgi:hypothetical protein
MPKYTVKDGGKLRHDGKTYGPGDTVELTEDQAKDVQHVLVAPPAAKADAAKAKADAKTAAAEERASDRLDREAADRREDAAAAKAAKK